MPGQLIGERLQEARTWAGYTQQEAADALGIARELISYWENERRTPGLAQLGRLAELYGTSTAYLLGQEDVPAVAEERAMIGRDLTGQSPQSRAEVQRWLAFLDAWAEVREEAGDRRPGPWTPPVRGWQSSRPITDSRRAPTLATEVRQHYDLGSDALPDLRVLLDTVGIDVYYAPLGPLNHFGISGVYLNHPMLGACLLVNTSTTQGRQQFTLAHEFAHALFHYQERGIVSRSDRRDGKERFADTFAAHFLVPRESLLSLVEGHESIGPLEVIELQRYFRVSYAMMLVRLRDEHIVSPDEYDRLRRFSPRALAAALGLDDREYIAPSGEPALGRFPISVLARIQRLVERGELSPQAAASLLDVSLETVQERLLVGPALATEHEQREVDELVASRLTGV